MRILYTEFKNKSAKCGVYTAFRLVYNVYHHPLSTLRKFESIIIFAREQVDVCPFRTFPARLRHFADTNLNAHSGALSHRNSRFALIRKTDNVQDEMNASICITKTVNTQFVVVRRNFVQIELNIGPPIWRNRQFRAVFVQHRVLISKKRFAGIYGI